MTMHQPITLPDRLTVPRDEFALLHGIAEVVRMLSRGEWHEKYARDRLREMVAELDGWNANEVCDDE